MNSKTLILLSTGLLVILVLFHFSAKKHPMATEAPGAANVQQPQQGAPFAVEIPNEPVLSESARPEQVSSDVAVEFLNNEKFVLSEQVGKKIIILSFFATWCDPCKEELFVLNSYVAERKNENLMVIGIDADDPDPVTRTFVRTAGLAFPITIDHGGVLRTTFSIKALPTTIFIGADGVARRYEAGQIQNAHAVFDAPLQASVEMIKAGKGITREAFLSRTMQRTDERQRAQ